MVKIPHWPDWNAETPYGEHPGILLSHRMIKGKKRDYIAILIIFICLIENNDVIDARFDASNDSKWLWEQE